MKVSLTQCELNYMSKVFSPPAMLVKHKRSSSHYNHITKRCGGCGMASDPLSERRAARGSKGGELRMTSVPTWFPTQSMRPGV